MCHNADMDQYWQKAGALALSLLEEVGSSPDKPPINSLLEACGEFFNLTSVKFISDGEGGVLYMWPMDPEQFEQKDASIKNESFLKLLHDEGQLTVGVAQEDAPPAFLQNYTIRSAVFLPLYDHGSVCGAALFEDDTRDRKFQDYEIAVMKNITALLSALIANERAEAQIQYAGRIKNVLLKFGISVDETVFEKSVDAIDAIDMDIKNIQLDIDQLTGLHNRNSGFELLSGFLKDRSENGGVFSVCFIDIDNLKAINLERGQAQGDQVIKTVARILENIKRDMDILCRMGDDEFLLILPSCSELNAQRVIGMFQENLALHNQTGANSDPISVSIGLLEVTDQVRMNADEIIKFLYGAMIQEKKQKL